MADPTIPGQEDQASVVARVLRNGRPQDVMIGTGWAPLQAIGKLWAQEDDNDKKMAAESGLKRLSLAATLQQRQDLANRWQAEQALRERGAAERERHNRWQEAHPQSGNPSFVYIQRPDGTVAAVSKKDPSDVRSVPNPKPLPGQPAPDTENETDTEEDDGLLHKPIRGQNKTIPSGDRKGLEEFSAQVRALASLSDKFRDEYAGMGAAGPARTAFNQKLGTWAPQKWQDQAQYWAEYNRTLDIIQRHALFGSALTPNESASWEQARTISSRTDPRRVKEAYRTLLSLAQVAVAKRAEALAADGYSPDAIRAAADNLWEPKKKTKKKRDAPANAPASNDPLNIRG